MTAVDEIKPENNIEDSKRWFDDMIANLQVDQLLFEVDVMDRRKKEVYEAMISKDEHFMHNYARKNSSAFFVQNLVESYFIELSTRGARPNKLALELSNSKVLVWAEIKDDDEVTEDALILASAKVNSDFTQYGFHITSTIVEESDLLTVPEHYTEVLIKRVS